MTVRAVVDDAYELAQRCFHESRAVRSEVMRHGGLVQRRERDLVAATVRAQLLREDLPEALADGDVRGAVRADDENARRLVPPHPGGEEVEGGAVAPMEVLEDQHER